MKTFMLVTVFLAGAFLAKAQPAILSATSNAVNGNIGVNTVATIVGTFGANTGLSHAFFTFEVWPSPQYSCKVGFGIPTNTVYLHDDDGNPMSPMTPGPNGGTESNSKCQLFASGSNIMPSGSNYVITVSVQFNAPYIGPKYIYMNGYDNYNQSSGWYCPNAEFTVNNLPNTRPQTISIRPAVGGAPTPGYTSFQATARDINGAFTIFHLEFMLEPFGPWQPGYMPGISQRCKVVAEVSANVLYLEDQQEDTPAGPGYYQNPNSSGANSASNNGRCTLYPVYSIFSYPDIDTVEVTFAVTLTPAFSGMFQNHMYVADDSGDAATNDHWDTEQDTQADVEQNYWTWIAGSGVSATGAQTQQAGGASYYVYQPVPNPGADVYGIITEYRSPGVSAVVHNQLVTMFANGQRVLKLPLYFDNNAQSYNPNSQCQSTTAQGVGAVIDASAGVMPPQCLQNLNNIIADARSVGFEKVYIGFYQSGGSEPFNYPDDAGNGTTLLNTVEPQTLGFIKSVHQDLDQNGFSSIIDKYSLGNEEISQCLSAGTMCSDGEDGSSYFTNALAYLAKLWNDYHSLYANLNDSTGFSVTCDDACSEKFNVMPSVYGSTFPPVLELHIFGGSMSEIYNAYVSGVSAQQSISALAGTGWIIGETNYNDPTEAAALTAAHQSQGNLVYYLIEFPATSLGPSAGTWKFQPPLGFFNYTNYGW